MRRGSSGALPPRAFSGYAEAQLKVAIMMLAKEQRFMAVRHLTVEDFRQLFVPQEYRHSLKEAFSVAAPNYLDQAIAVRVTSPYTYVEPAKHLSATFTWDRNECPEGFFAMHKQPHELQADVPDWLMEKWEYVERELSRISYDWGMVNHVFMELNTNGFCNTPQQMRFVWPAIRHLTAKAGMNDLANQLTEPSARAGDKARVPVAIREFLVPTVNIVNATLLMDKVNIQDKREFRLQVNNPGYETNGVTFHGMN